MRNKMILALWGIAKSMGCENNLKKNQIPADNVYSLTTQTIGVIMSKFDCYLFNSSPIAACIIQKKFIQLANDALLKLLGYTFNELKMFPLKRIILKPDYVRVMKNELDRLAARNSPVEYDFTIVDAHNNLIKVRGFFSVIKFFGKPATFVQILSIQQFNHENDLISDTIENCIKSMEIIASLPEVIFEMDTKGYVNFANVSASNFFGATLEDYQKGINALDYVIPADRERMKKNMGLLLGGDKVGISEYTIQKKDGKTIPAIIHSTPVIRNGCPIGLRGVIIDITERKEMEARIIRLSQCDILTGLYNRSYFDNELQKTKNSGILFGLVICDLDGLKLINDTMGHRKGDLLITSAANAMKDTFRSEDLIARIGGDEFAIILYNTDETMIKNLIRCLQLTIIHLHRNISEIPLTLSCGYAIRKNAL